MKKLGMFLMLMVAMAIAMPSNSYGQYDRMKKSSYIGTIYHYCNSYYCFST